jgi:phosphonoacetaldehyde hydrolase
MTIDLVVFDWSGTMLDFGSRAPLAAFLEAFAHAGVPISEALARRPMGSHKRDHIREIVHDPEVAERARDLLGHEPDAAFVDAIYADFSHRLPALLPLHAAPIPGAVDTLRWLRARGIRIGSTTGYTRGMMDTLEPLARAAHIDPEFVVCADEVSQGRPAPWACFRIAEQCGVYPLTRAVKVGDTPTDMAEGRNAGMWCVGVSESGNEMGLSESMLAALPADERAARVEAAAARLREAGAHTVLTSIAELPAWIESQG